MGQKITSVLFKPKEEVAFVKSADLHSFATAGHSIWVVGKKDRLCAAARELGDALGLPHLPRQAEALNAGYGGATAQVPWMDGETLRHVTLLSLPEAAGRCVSPTRPDAIMKHLHGNVSGHRVVLAVGEGDVLAAGHAVARCLSPYTAKTETTVEESVCNVTFFGCEPSDEMLKILGTTADCIRVAQGLTDLPPNALYPASFKSFALEAIKDLPNVSSKIIEGEELNKQGYGLLYAVGKAAATPPCLVVLTHNAAGRGRGVALIGKGITFDTGGAALKSRDGMCGMKRDMGGAAGMLGAFLALAKSGGLPSGQPLHCVLCIAENSIGSRCFLQDDILTGYSGLTVEINNTDAEGRLVLSDGAAHVARNLDCELVVDMATLTGTQGTATGKHHALFLASDERLEADTLAAGKVSGDMVHPGLFAPELLLHEFDSSFADMKNFMTGNAQSSCAGLFIYRHLTHCGYAGRWLHLDMAEPAYQPLGQFGTGWGVALLMTLLRGGLRPESQ